MVEEELDQEVYPQGQVKVDMEHVDHLTVMERVEVLNIIQKVNCQANYAFLVTWV